MTVVKITGTDTGIGSERHAPALSMESEVRNSLRALHVYRRHIFPGDMSTEILLTYLDTSKWLWLYFSQFEEIRNNTAAKVEILVGFIETILRKNAERFKRHEAFLSFDEINTYPTSVITRFKGRNPSFQATPQKRGRSDSAPQNRQPQSSNKRPNNRSASSSADRDPRYNPDGPKGRRFENSAKSIASLKKRLCRNWNTAGSHADGSSCNNKRSGSGCVARDNKTYVHRCNKAYEAEGEDGSLCNLQHPAFQHTG